MGLFTITTNAYVNQPPSQIGNGSTSTSYGSVKVLTRAMFTTLTTPVYADPEGDIAFQLKIISLPVTGILKLNNVDVTINQIIDFSDIDNDLFTYTPDNATTTSYSSSFNFEIADSGSRQFVG